MVELWVGMEWFGLDMDPTACASRSRPEVPLLSLGEKGGGEEGLRLGCDL